MVKSLVCEKEKKQAPVRMSHTPHLHLRQVAALHDTCLGQISRKCPRFVLFDAIVGSPSARQATKFRARRPSGAVHHFNPILKSSTRSRTHQEKPQQHCRQALDAHVAEAEQHSDVVSEGCIVSVERHGCHSRSCVRDSTHTRPILHTSCSC